MSAKTLIAAVVAVVVGLAIYGAYLYPKVQNLAGSAGNTFTTSRIAAIAADLTSTGTTGTTTSILNTDATTRYVTDVRLGCDGLGTSKTAYTGAGLAALTLTVGTSSTANANTVGATAKLFNAVTVPTSTTMYSISSSTSSTGAQAATLWHAGEYMTFQFNATNTAACTVGVGYLGS